MILSRRYLTLIELMIVLAIIGSIAGVIGMNINKAMQQQRFNTEVSFVVEQLRLAQNLMLVLNGDATVVISKQPNGYYALQMKLHCSLDRGWNKELVKEAKDLRSIVEINFENADPKFSAKDSNINIEFFSAGFVMSKGILELKSREGVSQYICLKGRPIPISATERRPSCSLEMPPEDEKITSITKEEINEKMQQKMQKKKHPQENEAENLNQDLNVKEESLPKVQNPATVNKRGQ